MLRLRRCRRGPLMVVMGVASLCYLYSWILDGVVNEDSDWLDERVERGDHIMTQKPDPTKPPIYFRHQEVKERCQLLTRPQTYQHPRVLRFPMNPLISKKPKIFFCPLAKAGSTFFTRYFMAMNRGGPMVNPYKIDIQDASREKQPTFMSIHPFKEQTRFLNESFKFVFTRHPYSRIFSAYVDKLFSPNPYYWKDWGLKAVRQNALDKGDHPCGSQVSFKDFIKTVITSLWKSDLHFIPMNTMCKFCEVHYNLVGRVEESSTDIEFLSQRINMSSSFLHEKSYKSSAIEDTINDSTMDAISTWRNDVSKCIPLYDSGRMVWRKLQVRGVIDASVTFPFNEEEMKSVKLEDFRRECFKAANNSRDSSRLKRQKLVAYQYAYSSLPQLDIVRLQQIYKRDFMLLNYDMTRPDASVSNGGGFETSDPLDWRSDWNFE